MAHMNDLHLVYETLPAQEHRLRKGDILREDRQNWAAAQRLFSQKSGTVCCLLSREHDTTWPSHMRMSINSAVLSCHSETEYLMHHLCVLF